MLLYLRSPTPNLEEEFVYNSDSDENLTRDLADGSPMLLTLCC